jgi:hypothetical protein
VQTSDGKVITLYTEPSTAYQLNNREARLVDIRVGADIEANYVVREDRNIANLIIAGPVVTTEVVYPSSRVQTIQGRITKIASPNFLVLTTSEGKEIPLYLDLQKDFTIKYVDTDNKRVVTALQTTMPTTLETVDGPVTRKGARIEGTIVRVSVKTNPQEIVVKTTTGQEVIVLTSPEAKYRIDNEDVSFDEVQIGLPVTVIYDVDQRRNLLRSLSGLRRK